MNPLLGTASASLAAGALIYALARPLPAALLPAALHLPSDAIAWLAPLTGSLPTLLHVVAFSLVTVIVVGRHRTVRACAAWTAINLLCEIAQHADVAQTLLQWWPAAPTQVRAYLLGGTFDWNDVVAAVVGGIAAYVVAIRLSREDQDAHR
jgi:hypothetical protein